MIDKTLQIAYRGIPIFLFTTMVLIISCIALGYSILGEIPTYGKLESTTFKYVQLRNLGHLCVILSLAAVPYWPIVAFFYIHPRTNKIPNRKAYAVLYVLSIALFLTLSLAFENTMEWYFD